MKKNLLAASSLLSSTFIFMLGNGLITLLLPIRLHIENFHTATIGGILAFYSVGLLLGGLYCKYLIRRVGHIRMFAACGALSAVSILACALLTHSWLWAVMRIVNGFCNATIFTAIESWLSSGSTPKSRGKILAIYQIVMQSAGFLGQFMINLSSPAGDTLFIICAMLQCLATIPILLSRQPGPKIADVKPMSFITMAKISPLGFTGCFFAGVMYFTIFNLLPLFATKHGVSSFDTSIIMAGCVFGAFALQMPVGYLADKYDRRQVMISLLAIAIALSLTIPTLLRLELFWLPVILNGIICGIMTCCYPLSIAEAYDKLRKEEIISAMGTLLVAYATGGIIGPIIISRAMAHWGDDSLYYTIALTQALFAAIIFLRMRMRKALPIDQQESFVFQSAAMPSASNLDPRTKFRAARFPLSREARTAISVAESDPSAAVKMACALAKKKPKYSHEIAHALASVEKIDILRLAYALSETVPSKRRRIFRAVLEAREDQALEIITFFAEHYIEELSDFAYTISSKMPQLRLIMAKVAFETLPESTDEIAEFYAQEFSDDLESARPADAASGENEKNAADLVSHIADIAPEKTMNVAVKVVESMPESAANIAKDMASTLAGNYINDNSESNTKLDTEKVDDGVTLPSMAQAIIDEAIEGADIITVSGNIDDAIASQLEEMSQQQRNDYTDAVSEAIAERVADSAVDIVQRLSEAAPENSIDIAVAVVASVPESSAQVAEALMLDSAEQLLNADVKAPVSEAINDTDDEQNPPPENTADEVTAIIATPHDGALELLSRLKAAAPEQAEEMTLAVLKMINEINPELAEVITQTINSPVADNHDNEPEQKNDA